MRKLISVAGVSAILVATLLFVQRAMPQSKQPKIIWTPPDVYAGITSTTTITKTLTFTSDQPLQNVVLEAVPQISGFIQIQPTKLTLVPASSPQTVQLVFSAPAGSQFGAYDGTIHLRIGSTTLPQTLKASVTFAVVPLPPDPGQAGTQTLAGIDSDGDGVRDDVERWIAFTFADSAKRRAGATQFAQGLQLLITGATDSQTVLANTNTEINGMECLDDIDSSLKGGVVPSSQASYSKVLAQELNTDARTRVYYTDDQELSGHFFGSSGGLFSTCNVNVTTLPN